MKSFKGMKTNKINKDVILEAIQQEANAIVRKNELYEQVKMINEELKKIYEHGPITTSFGFVTDGDASSKTKTGFENHMNISHIARLEQEMSESEADNQLSEMDSLRAENEKLKEQINQLTANAGK